VSSTCSEMKLTYSGETHDFYLTRKYVSKDIYATKEIPLKSPTF